MLEMELTNAQRQKICAYLGYGFVVEWDNGVVVYTQVECDTIGIPISDAQLMAIIQQRLNNTRRRLEELTEILEELHTTEPEEAT